MHKLERYPFDSPNTNRMSIKRKSELMTGVYGIVEDGRWTLHIKNKGTNRVRARESVRSFLADQIRTAGMEQIYRPRKSPTLKTRK